MELQHLDVRLPARAQGGFEPAAAIAIFHAWVRDQTGAERVVPELLVDVADYRHVPGGPGVLLIGHEADYALEGDAGAFALRYQRKAALPGSNAERLAQALGAAARAALRLAAEPAVQGRLRFGLDGLRVVVNDRGLAPNSPATAEALLPELRRWFAEVLGHDAFTLEPESEPRRRFGVTLRTGRAPELPELLNKLQP